MIAIGVIGENGAGKGTFVSNIETKLVAAGVEVEVLKFSDVLSDTLKVWNLLGGRGNLQRLSASMSVAFGPEALANAVYGRISICHDASGVLLLDGVRSEADAAMVGRFSRHFLVYITARPEVRHKRARDRGEKFGEDVMSFEQFMEEGRAKVEAPIPIIGARAHVKIINNDSLEDYEGEIKKFFEDCLKDKL